MAVTVHEAIMDAGEVSIDVDYTPETYDAVWDSDNNLPRNLFILVRNLDSGLLAPPFVLRWVDGDERGLTIGGPGVLWALGSKGVGPTIEDREYLSDANKLSNPDFSFNPPEALWTTGDSVWVIGTGFAATFSTVEIYDDQILLSEEPFRAVPGASYTSSATIGRIVGYGVGHLRLRHVYTGGPFTYPNLFPAYSSWGASTGTDLGQTDLQVIGNTMRAGPSAMPNLVPNGSFDDGGGSLNGFIQVTGNWYLGTTGGHNGPNFAFTNSSTTPVLKVLASDALGGVTLPQHPRTVTEAEEYELWMVTRTNPGFSDTDGEVYLATNLAGDLVDAKVIETPHARPDDGHSDWRLLWTRFNVDPGYSNTAPALAVLNQTLGQWDFDDITLIRKKGNIDVITSPSFPVSAGRPYVWRQNVRTNAGYISGSVSRALVCSATGRDDVEIMGPAVYQTDAADQIQDWDFTIPSGFTSAKARYYCQDVEGASVYLLQENSTIVQTDTSTWIAETISPNPNVVTGTLSVTSTAPVGAKDIHLEVIAEAFGIGWVVGGLSLKRDAPMPAVGDTIISDLLTSPTTGQDLSIRPGYVTCHEYIPYDWRIINLTVRAALDYFCNVVSIPTREYRVAATDPPNLDVAEASVLFIDHTPDGPFPVVLLGGMVKDPDVEDVNPPETDTSDRATEIVLHGAERTLVSGGTMLITASAPVPGPVEYDYRNRPDVRRKYVTAPNVDHFGYAQALVEDLAAKEADPPISVPIVLNEIDDDTAALLDIPPRPAFDVGAWIYVDKPEARLRDASNPVMIGGVEYFPRRVRVLDRDRELLNGIIDMRHPNGTTFELEGVNWSEKSVTRLTVGDRLVDWEADPQGRSEAEQYLADRKTRPR